MLLLMSSQPPKAVLELHMCALDTQGCSFLKESVPSLQAPSCPATRWSAFVSSCHACRLQDDTRSDPAVLQHLKAEASYAGSVLQGLEGLEEELHRDMAGRVPDQEAGPPFLSSSDQRDTPRLPGQVGVWRGFFLY